MAKEHSTAPSRIAEKYVVHGLFDPRTGALRYIGKTNCGARQRLSGHMCDAKRHPHTHIARWIAALGRNGLRPEYRVLDTCLYAEMLGELERKWIKRAKLAGERLTNATDGGEGALGWKPSDTTREKFRQRRNVWLGRRHNKDSIAKMSVSCKSAWESPELRHQQSLRHAGKVLTDSHLETLRARGVQDWSDPDHRAATVEKLKAARARCNAYAKRAETLRGKPRSHQIIDSDGRVYPSIKAAAEALGVRRNTVSRVVNGHGKTVRGKIVRYYVSPDAAPGAA